MIEDITINQRLKIISTYLSRGTIFADIGSDHAFLPAYVCLNDSSARAIAGEVNEGPYQRALETVKKYELSSVIDVRLGDGLDVLKKNEIRELVIAGMGGTLITTILEKGKEKLGAVERIIVQPNINERKVREWLYSNQFRIRDEKMIKENGHIYEVIVGERVKDKQQTYEMDSLSAEELKKQLMFGPFLLKSKTAVFYEKWNEQKNKHKNIIEQMKQAQVRNESKIEQFEKELKWIEEVLS